MKVDILKNGDLENTCNKKETKLIFRKHHLGGPSVLDNINIHIINILIYINMGRSSVIAVQDHSGKDTPIFARSEKEAGTDGGDQGRDRIGERNTKVQNRRALQDCVPACY